MKKKVFVVLLSAFIVIAFVALRNKYSTKVTGSSQAISLDWSMSPASIIDLDQPVTFFFHLKDKHNRPIKDARILVEANMNHAGMIPVKAEAFPDQNDSYKASIKLTMDGDWILFLTIITSDGEMVKKELFFRTSPK